MNFNFQDVLGRLGIRRGENDKCGVIEVRPDGLRFVLVDKLKGLVTKCQVFNIEERQKYTNERLLADLTDLVRHYGLKDAECGIVLHPSYYRLHVVDVPDVPRSEYRKAARWQLRDIIDLPLEDICLDVFLGEPGRGSERLYVVSARKQQLQGLVDCFVMAGLQVKFLDVREFAIRNLLVRMYGVQGVWSAACLDDEQCAMQVTSNGYLQFVRRVPMEIDAVFHGDVTRFVSEVGRSWEYVNSEFALPRPGRLLIMPTVHLSIQILKELNEVLGTSVVPLHFEERHYKRLMLDGDFDSDALEDCWAALGGSYRLLDFDGIE